MGSSNLIVKLIEPDSPIVPDDPIVPDNPAVPNTGLFTSLFNNFGTIINVFIFVAMFAFLAILVFTLIKRHKKQLSNSFRINQLNFSLAKRSMALLSVFAFAISVFTFLILNNNSGLNLANAEGKNPDTSDALSLDIEEHDLSIIPNEKGAFGYTYHNITVAEPTGYGYTLTTYANSKDLVNTKDEENFISGLDSSSTSALLSTNTWGLSTTEPTDEFSEIWGFVPTVDAEAIILKNTESSTPVQDTTTAYYGVNVNTDLAYGDYTNVINYVVVANHAPSISDFEYLQDFDSLSSSELNLVKNTMEANTEYTLKDKRDGTDYTIAKIQYTNQTSEIWMTQNLKLDLNDIDLSSDEKIDFFKDNSNISTASDDQSLNDFINKAKTATSQSTWCTLSDEECTNQVLYNSSNIGTQYDSYGIYYNHYTATIGSSVKVSSDGDNVPNDICPAGWHLPVGGKPDGDLDNNDFYKINKAVNHGTTATPTGLIEGPVKFTNSSLYYDEGVSGFSHGGYYFSSTINSLGQPYYLGFDVNDVYLAHRYAAGKFEGLTVRCIIK